MIDLQGEEVFRYHEFQQVGPLGIIRMTHC